MSEFTARFDITCTRFSENPLGNHPQTKNAPSKIPIKHQARGDGAWESRELESELEADAHGNIGSIWGFLGRRN